MGGATGSCRYALRQKAGARHRPKATRRKCEGARRPGPTRSELEMRARNRALQECPRAGTPAGRRRAARAPAGGRTGRHPPPPGFAGTSRAAAAFRAAPDPGGPPPPPVFRHTLATKEHAGAALPDSFAGKGGAAPAPYRWIFSPDRNTSGGAPKDAHAKRSMAQRGATEPRTINRWLEASSSSRTSPPGHGTDRKVDPLAASQPVAKAPASAPCGLGRAAAGGEARGGPAGAGGAARSAQGA